MPQFRCPSCDKTLSVEDKYAGRKTVCPCGYELMVPVVARKIPANPSRPDTSSNIQPAVPQQIKLKCPCGKLLQTNRSAEGKSVRCPGCERTLRVPESTTAKTSQTQATHAPGSAAPLPDLPNSATTDPLGSSFKDEDWLGTLPPASQTPVNTMTQGISRGSFSATSFGSQQEAPGASKSKASANRYLAQAEEEMADQRMRAASQGVESGSMWNAGAIAGIGMMLLATVWFVGAYYGAGRIYFYPPVLFIAGLISLTRAILD